jgi:hypothetical protein
MQDSDTGIRRQLTTKLRAKVDEEADEENSAPKLRLVEVGGILHDVIALLKRAKASFIY